MKREREYDICVVGGGGHVGLPLSIALADKGRRTVIYDINSDVINKINNGIMPFMEKGAEDILRNVINKSLFTSSSPESIAKSKYIVIIIGTPVDEHLNPTFAIMKRMLDEIVPFLDEEQVIILRSTVYPGTTKKIREMLREKYPGIEVCFCPERIAEGKAMEELYSLPQIISGFDEKAIGEVKKIFELLTNEVIVTGVLEAELAKLFSNSWRYIQFATANQFYMIAEEYGADFYDVYNAMTHNYPRTANFPKPGFAAGPCLFKDTMQISAFANNKFFLGHSAMLINEGLPNFLVQQMKKEHELGKKAVGILGMAFKAESDDPRESLSYKLRKILQLEAREVFCSDAYIQNPHFIGEEELIKRSDIIIIGAPHKKYKGLDYMGKEIVDVWDFVGK